MTSSPPRQQVTRVLIDWRNGDREAAGRLMPLVYDELRRLARGYLQQERCERYRPDHEIRRRSRFARPRPGDNTFPPRRNRLFLGETLTRMGQLAEGENYLRRALERGSPKWPKEDRFLAQTQRALGENLQAQERFAEAEPLLRAAYEGTKARLGEDHPQTVRAAERVRKIERARAE